MARTALVNRLRATTSTPLVTVTAPAGYGKTTFLSQWAERDSRAFVWVTLDDHDNDPLVLLRHIAAALGKRRPLGTRVVDALRSPRSSLWRSAVPRLAAALSAENPLVLVLDDFGCLRARDSLATITALIGEGDAESMIVAAGRVPPRLPVARFRARGELLELGTEELALTKREAQMLLDASGVALGDQLIERLVAQCEGWPAALSLAALSTRDGRQAGRDVARFGGDDRYLTDFLRSEYLSHLRPGMLRFLRRTSVLERMCGPLCDAILQEGRSAQALQKIERANLFLVALDNRREWFRYHQLFRGLLQRELAEHEPELVPVLHRRAADWFTAHGDEESALEHALAAGDTDRAAAIVAAIAPRVYDAGSVSTVERWLGRFEREGLLERYPAVALQGCRVHILRGRAEQAKGWLKAAKRDNAAEKAPDGGRSLRPCVAVVRAWLCGAGPRQMLADAEAAAAELPNDSDWRPCALVAHGIALILLGEDTAADQVLASAAESAEAQRSTETRVVALAERALLAAQRGDHQVADELSGEASRAATSLGIEAVPGLSIAYAVAGRLLLRRGRWNEARARLIAAHDLIAALTVAMPWLAVQTRIELAHGFIALRDAGRTQELLGEIDELLSQVPELGVLRGRADELRREAEDMPESERGSVAGLTPAELRLLPLLATHLSFREIAEQLYVSRNTVKTQAISVYRKLGVSSRSEAIAEARRLGLGEHLQVVLSNGR